MHNWFAILVLHGIVLGMKALIYALVAGLCLGVSVQAGLRLAVNGKPAVVIVTQPGATEPEKWAAKDLADTLGKIAGAKFEVVENASKVPSKAIVVGQGTWVEKTLSDVPWASLGDEEIIIRTSGSRLVLAGGRPRGTLYAVSRFLQDECGVRWWTPWASEIPKRPNLRIDKINLRAQPVFEARDPFWFSAFDGPWAVHNFSNSQSARITDAMGGRIVYKGFVHTFFSLVPPEKYFKDKPEWFSMIDGKRKFEQAQLCLSNPELRDFVVEQVRQWLKESPEARIVSVSQNDWHGACQCPQCKALDDAEGSHAGSLLAFVNYVAEKIEKDYPNVAIDTLAYQYTRQAPRTLKPRPNVIIRLCSIECNFGVPLSDPANESFARDIRDWAKICQRLYIWDYVTDFAHYLQPHPNWFVLGDNVRFFHQNNVKGLFEQGAYQSSGAEMAEMRAWVLAQLMWNPKLDDRELIHEFLNGYYGAGAARYIRDYMNLMHTASRGHNLTCYSPTTAPFLKFKTLAEAERLWQKAEAAAAQTPDLLWRVRLAHMPVRYVWLSEWTSLRKECKAMGAEWPLPSSRKAVADEFLSLAVGQGPEGWSKITHLNESGLSPNTFVARFVNDPAE